MSKNSFIQVYAANREVKGRKGWVVRRVRHPTARSGSKVLWSKKFSTEAAAHKYATSCRKREKK